eukprot:s2181_g11.t1
MRLRILEKVLSWIPPALRSAERSSDSDLMTVRELAAEARRLRTMLGDPRPTSSTATAADGSTTPGTSATTGPPLSLGEGNGTNDAANDLEHAKPEEDRASECPPEEDACVDTPFSTGDATHESSTDSSSSDGGLGHEGGTRD